MSSTRVAAVTGGAQGIGRGIAERLLAEGWTVYILDAHREAGEATEAELRRAGDIHFLPADVAVEADVVRALGELDAEAGRLELLVNNAGIAVNKPLAQLDLEEWNRVLGVNLTGAFLCSKHAAPLLARNGEGAIINIASTRALMSEPDTEAYSASKGGLVALTHALAVSLGPGVRVNCISPGWIDVSAWKFGSGGKGEALSERDHAQHPAGRVGRPEDVAALVSFLASADSGFVTGANFTVDGGMTRKMIYAE